MALAVILVAATLIRFYRIGDQSFWVDEMLSLGASSTPEGVSFWEKILHDVHGPLHTVIIHILRQISTAEYLLRAPSAAAGVLSVYFVYRWFIILGRRDIALYGALFLALHPYNLYYSQELRFYSLLTLFVILSMISFERYLRDPTAKNGLVLGVTLSLVSLSHFSALFLPVGFFVYLLVSRRLDRRYVAAGLIAAAVLLVAVSPWIYREIKILSGIDVVNISTLPVEERLRGDLTLNPWSYPYTFYAFSVGYSFGPDLRLLHGVDSALDLLGAFWRELLLVALLFGFLLINGMRNSAKGMRLALFLSVALTAAVLVTVIALLNIKVFNVRYLTVLFPVYLALIAHGLPRGRLSRPIAALAVCAVLVLSSWNYHMEPRYSRDDIRSAVKRIELEEERGDLILAINSVSAVEHYYGGPNRVKEIIPLELGREEIDKRADRYMDRGGRVWFIRCRHWDTDPMDTVLEALQREGVIVAQHDFPGVRLFLFEGMDQSHE